MNSKNKSLNIFIFDNDVASINQSYNIEKNISNVYIDFETLARNTKSVHTLQIAPLHHPKLKIHRVKFENRND
jgi:hypothetical protein